MEKAARLIIEMDNDIVFIKRNKMINGGIKEFYVLPGGVLNENETYEAASIREAKEELTIDIEIESFFIEQFTEELNKLERFYFAKIIKGTPKNGTGEEFLNQNINTKYGTYEVLRLPKAELSAYTILPINIKDKLVATYVG